MMVCLWVGLSLLSCAQAGDDADELEAIAEVLGDQDKACVRIFSVEKREAIVVVICQKSKQDASSRVTHTLVVDHIGL
jgi:hypothetical protein